MPMIVRFVWNFPTLALWRLNNNLLNINLLLQLFVKWRVSEFLLCCFLKRFRLTLVFDNKFIKTLVKLIIVERRMYFDFWHNRREGRC